MRNLASVSRFLHLWWRLGIVAAVIWAAYLAVFVLSAIDGWLYYSRPEDLLLRLGLDGLLALVAAGLSGLAASVLFAPLWMGKSDSTRAADMMMRRCAVFAALILIGQAVLVFDRWLGAVLGAKAQRFIPVSPLTWDLLCAGLAILATAALEASGRFRRFQDKAAAAFADPLTRRTVLATGGGALAATGLGLGRMSVLAEPTPRRPAPVAARPNVILITFDSLCADDLSLYGAPLPTTPFLDAFAAKASVFDRYYSTATFTTPAVASFLSGRYPGDLRIHQLEGKFQPATSRHNIAAVLHAAGYTTAATTGNPWAHPNRLGIGGDFDLVPPMPAQFLRVPALLLGVPRSETFDDVAMVTRTAESLIGGSRPTNTFKMPPEANFAQAGEMLRGLKDRPHFLWVHVWAPHEPYVPRAPFLGRFTSAPETQRLLRENPNPPRNYPPDLQPVINAHHLRYAEWIADADAAFGAFLTQADSEGLLDNAVVAVSADHGQSHAQGYFGHQDPGQRMGTIHIPLMVRRPGQSLGQRIGLVADHTSLAPTLLDLAGLPAAPWTAGPSLRPLLEGTETGTGHGHAFSQHMEKNSAFAPISTGSVGIVTTEHRYLLDLGSGQGMAHTANGEPATDAAPQVVAELRARIFQQFPDLPNRTA